MPGLATKEAVRKLMLAVISQCLQRRLISLIHAPLPAIFLRARLSESDMALFVSRLFIKQII